MNMAITAKTGTRSLMSGNEAIARAVWEAGVRLASAYPGTPSTEILETLAFYPEMHAEWSVNEKVALEVAFGATMTGARAFCAMKHVGLNVASDPLMTITLTGVKGGMVIAVADDVGMSSSQNEQDSRFWGRFAHLPILEPIDSQDAYDLTKLGFELSERFQVPVILRLTTRVCHVKSLVATGSREEREIPGFTLEPSRWVMVPAYAKRRLGLMHERDKVLADFSETTDLNVIEPGSDRRVGFVVSGPAYLHLREVFPAAPVFKLAFTHPLPIEKIRAFAGEVDRLVVVEETEPVVEKDLRAAGIAVYGKDILPGTGELTADIIGPPLRRLIGDLEPAAGAGAGAGAGAAPARAPVFPRPPTLCSACPHLGIYHALYAMRRRVIITGDIGCYTLGSGHPWNALDCCISMGASMGMAQGIDKARGKTDEKKAVVAVIGDSTFLHMGIQGLLNIVYNRGNVTILLLDNRTTGMTGGQNHAGTGRDLHGEPAPRVDFAQLVEVLGVKKERIRVVDVYDPASLFKALRDETKVPEPSVIITNRPCVLIDSFERHAPFKVLDDACTGCSSCMDIGCPAISVRRRATEVIDGDEVNLVFTTIDSTACTGCTICASVCNSKAIVPVEG
jgi:indolepyruvate ferredoxin oxidoreductase alpha subunit